jgi:hypothetical protein
MPALILLVVFLVSGSIAAAQETVSFPTQDGGLIYAHLYGAGERAVVLVHGGRFNPGQAMVQLAVLIALPFFQFRRRRVLH